MGAATVDISFLVPANSWLRQSPTKGARNLGCLRFAGTYTSCVSFIYLGPSAADESYQKSTCLGYSKLWYVGIFYFAIIGSISLPVACPRPIISASVVVTVLR